MGRISKAMKQVPDAIESLRKVTDEVTDASQDARKALKRSDSGGSAPRSPSGTTSQSATSGPVRKKVFDDASPDEVKQFENYVAGSNRAVEAGVLSKTGRSATTKNGVRRQAEKAAYKERKRAEQAGTPYQGVAGHVPDATWMGQGDPNEWQDMSKRVNSSLAGQANRYPEGYKPTHFELEYPDGTVRKDLS